MRFPASEESREEIEVCRRLGGLGAVTAAWSTDCLETAGCFCFASGRQTRGLGANFPAQWSGMSPDSKTARPQRPDLEAAGHGVFATALEWQ